MTRNRHLSVQQSRIQVWRRGSPEWLAEVTGITQRKLYRRLHTTVPAGLTVEELNAIAFALDVHPSELLRD